MEQYSVGQDDSDSAFQKKVGKVGLNVCMKNNEGQSILLKVRFRGLWFFCITLFIKIFPSVKFYLNVCFCV